MNKAITSFLGAAGLSLMAATSPAQDNNGSEFSSYATGNIQIDFLAQSLSEVYEDALTMAKCYGNNNFGLIVMDDNVGILIGEVDIPSLPYEAVLKESDDYSYYALSKHYNLIVRAAAPVQFYSASTRQVLLPFELPEDQSYLTFHINHQIGDTISTLTCTLPTLD